MTWIDVPKTFTVRPFSVGHTTSMIDLPQMSSGGLLPTGFGLAVEQGCVDIQPHLIICSTSCGTSKTFSGSITGSSLPSSSGHP